MNGNTGFRSHTILVVDDFAPWRRVVQRMFESDADFKISGAATTGREAVSKAAELQPDVVLMDISLPDISGLEATREIRKACPASRVLFLSEKLSPALIKAAFEVGGLGYVLKSDCHEDLMAGIRTVLRGGQFISRSLKSGHNLEGETQKRTRFDS